MKNFLYLPAVAIAKAGLFLLPIFIWLQACSQAPAPASADQQSNSILSDTSGVVISDSPDGNYRLFKYTRKVGEQTETDLRILRLKDLKGALVSTLRTEPKAYWSSDSKDLITENSVPDSVYQREVVIYSVGTFEIYRRKQGQLINYDLVNNVVFMYTYDSTRQTITAFRVDNTDSEKRQEIVAPPAGRIPIAILAPLEKKAKIKAYTTGGAAVNIAFNY